MITFRFCMFSHFAQCGKFSSCSNCKWSWFYNGKDGDTRGKYCHFANKVIWVFKVSTVFFGTGKSSFFFKNSKQSDTTVCGNTLTVPFWTLVFQAVFPNAFFPEGPLTMQLQTIPSHVISISLPLQLHMYVMVTSRGVCTTEAIFTF